MSAFRETASTGLKPQRGEKAVGRHASPPEPPFRKGVTVPPGGTRASAAVPPGVCGPRTARSADGGSASANFMRLEACLLPSSSETTLSKFEDSEKPLLLVEVSEGCAVTSDTGPQSTTREELVTSSFTSSSSSLSGFFSVSIVNKVLMMFLVPRVAHFALMTHRRDTCTPASQGAFSRGFWRRRAELLQNGISCT